MKYRKSCMAFAIVFAIGTVLSAYSQAESVITTIPQPGDPNRVAVNLLTGLVYVADSGAGIVSVIDPRTNTVVNSFQVGIDPVGVGVNPSTSRLYVSDII